MITRFQQLSPTQRELLRKAWEGQQFYGEPLPDREPEKRSFLRALEVEGILRRARYQGEDCYRITMHGATIYQDSDVYRRHVAARPDYALPGT